MKCTKKALKTIFVGLLLLASFLSLFSGFESTQAGSQYPLLRATLNQNTWIADGTTQYRVAIVADSSPMAGQNTRVVQFRYILPTAPGYQFNLVGVTQVPENDFFTGFTTQPVPPADDVLGRGLSAGGNGPGIRNGNLVYLWFTVTNIGGSNPVNARFDFIEDESTFFRRPASQGGIIPADTIGTNFQVRPVNWQPPVIVINASSISRGQISSVIAQCPDDGC